MPPTRRHQSYVRRLRSQGSNSRSNAPYSTNEIGKKTLENPDQNVKHGELCFRCQSINVVDMVRWRGDLYERRSHDLGSGPVIAEWYIPWEYRYKLGPLHSLTYSQNCPVCGILKC